MAYCTVNDMAKLLPASMLINLSNDVSGSTIINQTNADECIDQADREIDAYVALAGYAVPMDPVPPLIANLSAKIAIWNLHLRKYFDSEIWRETYKQCLRTLERIAEGKLSIGQEEDGVATTGNDGVAVATRTQKFTEDFMSEF